MTPNLLTILRIILTPLFIILLFSAYSSARFWALVVFVIAAVTDAYDGHLARKYNQVTEEGKFLDPLADKILVLSAFISFAFMEIIDYWMVGLIIFRDLFVTGLRFAMASKGLEMVTSGLAKLKTGFQITIIIISLIFLGLQGLAWAWAMPILAIIDQYRLIYVLTFMVTLFTIYTGVNYLHRNRPVIQKFLSKSA